MQRAERVSSLVCTVLCFRARLLATAGVENGFVDDVAHVHGYNLSSERFPLRPYSLLLHGTAFHP